MADPIICRPRARTLALGLLLIVATVMRLHHFQGPLLDQLYVKQIYEANHARNIARAPLNPFRMSLDFLNEDGDRMVINEEVPLFNGILGVSYRAFGEHEWLGRVVSLLATLVAILALYDLMRREFDRETGLVAAFLLAMTPLLVFYGRAVLPDPGMLACMVLCAGFYRRYLDEGERTRWLIASGVAGLLAAMFKYYGLVILIPLADMAYRQGGWRAWFTRRFILLVAAVTVPIFLWIVGVFLRFPNPTTRTAYFFWQVPGSLWSPRLYQRLTLGLFVNDCGPVTAVLIAIGVVGALRGKRRSRPLWSWTAVGVAFLFLFAPKLMDHDYYELLILPVLATWGALGWKAAEEAVARRWPRATLATGAATVLVIAIIQSPSVMKAKYEVEVGHMVVAERLKQICPPDGKVVVIGQRIGWPEVHYSRRQGWVEQCYTLPGNWRESFEKYRRLGAEYVAVYFDPTVTGQQRASFAPLIAALPQVEHQSGPWFRNRRQCEYYILSLRDASALMPGAESQVAGQAVERR